MGKVEFTEGEVVLNWKKLTNASGLYKTNITKLDCRNIKLLEDTIVIKGLPLKEFYWPPMAPEDYLVYLKKCKTLETLFIPKGIFTKSDLKQIPSHIQVEYYQ